MRTGSSVEDATHCSIQYSVEELSGTVASSSTVFKQFSCDAPFVSAVILTAGGAVGGNVQDNGRVQFPCWHLSKERGELVLIFVRAV